MAMSNQADEQLRQILSEDEYADLMKIRERKETRNQKAQITEVARALVFEGGKYAEEYNTAQDMVDSIWDKAVNEATIEVTGIDPDTDVEDDEDED